MGKVVGSFHGKNSEKIKNPDYYYYGSTAILICNLLQTPFIKTKFFRKVPASYPHRKMFLPYTCMFGKDKANPKN
jgi:hypothetical protein